VSPYLPSCCITNRFACSHSLTQHGDRTLTVLSSANQQEDATAQRHSAELSLPQRSPACLPFTVTAPTSARPVRTSTQRRSELPPATFPPLANEGKGTRTGDTIKYDVAAFSVPRSVPCASAAARVGL
jgi:hypothetical protein